MRLCKILITSVILLVSLFALNACQVESLIENYTWVLTSYGESGNMQAPLEGTEITIFFDSKERTVSGSGGCNHYSGTYTLDGLDLTIGEDMAVTEMWCGEEKGEQERQYLETLAAAESFQINQGKLVIYCGQQILNFIRQEEQG
jgi:heat shock protein HslJ